MQAPRITPRAGFSLFELAVTMTILVLLVGVVGFRQGGPVERTESDKVVSLVERLEEACAAYHTDTGEYAYEYTNYAEAHRRLSAGQNTSGWGGPYLDGPLEHNLSNPFGSVHLYNNPRANEWIPGFDMDGDGMIDLDSDANMLWLSGIDEECAMLLNDTFDEDVEGEWSESGRVRWSSSSRYAWVMVHR